MARHNTQSLELHVQGD